MQLPSRLSGKGNRPHPRLHADLSAGYPRSVTPTSPVDIHTGTLQTLQQEITGEAVEPLAGERRRPNPDPLAQVAGTRGYQWDDHFLRSDRTNIPSGISASRTKSSYSVVVTPQSSVPPTLVSMDWLRMFQDLGSYRSVHKDVATTF